MKIEDVEKLFVPIDHQEECAICGFILDNKVFPLEFPDDWKFCCSCFAWAQFITNPDAFTSNEERNTIIKNSKIINKIYKKITLTR